MDTEHEPEEEVLAVSSEDMEKGSKEQEYLEGWQRARADLENIQKRMASDRVQQHIALKRDIAESLIGLADNFKSLVDHAPQDSRDPWVTGVVHVARQFEQTLEEFGVSIIQEVSVPFDPAIHEAVGEVEGSENAGSVVEIVQAGYKLGSVVIRPAKVKISA